MTQARDPRLDEVAARARRDYPDLAISVLSPGDRRNPYVGDGEDGARRSADIDREEADGLSQGDPRQNDLLSSADRWEQQADELMLERLDLRPAGLDRVGTLVLPSGGPGHYTVDVLYDSTPFPGRVDVGGDHRVNIHLQPVGSNPYLFVWVGLRQGPGGPPFRTPRAHFRCSRLQDPRFQLGFVHVNDMPLDVEPLGTFPTLAAAISEYRRHEAATMAAPGFPIPLVRDDHMPNPHNPAPSYEPLGPPRQPLER